VGYEAIKRQIEAQEIATKMIPSTTSTKLCMVAVEVGRFNRYFKTFSALSITLLISK
jgi:hypothetical protein